MSRSGDSRFGKKRGKYILHKTNPTSFKKGLVPANKGISKYGPVEGDKECLICHKTFHYKRSGFNPAPKTCSNECRYKSASITGTHHISQICVNCGNRFFFPPSSKKHRATIYCSLKCRRSAKMSYTEFEKNQARLALQRAVRKGTILKLNCQKCGNPLTEAHHPMGYRVEYWLTIQWLCRKHHTQEHNKMRREGINKIL